MAISANSGSENREDAHGAAPGVAPAGVVVGVVGTTGVAPAGVIVGVVGATARRVANYGHAFSP